MKVAGASAGERRYRTKIEVLRDLVEAATREGRKTRIIGVANLNQSSFDRYAALAASMGLLEPRGKGFVATRLAHDWLEAVDAVLGKGSEVAAALNSLAQLTPGIRSPSQNGNGAGGGSTLQTLARLAWADLVVSHQSISVARRAGPPPVAVLPGSRRMSLGVPAVAPRRGVAARPRPPGRSDR